MPADGRRDLFKKDDGEMCGHDWEQVNDCFVCLRCGLTRTFDGKILFDRKLADINKNHTGRQAKRRKKGEIYAG